MCRYLELLINEYKKGAELYYNDFSETNNTFSVLFNELFLRHNY